MWFNDIDIHLRHDPTPPRSQGVAPGRLAAARARYLERQRCLALEARRRRFTGCRVAASAQLAALTRSLTRAVLAAGARTWQFAPHRPRFR